MVTDMCTTLMLLLPTLTGYTSYTLVKLQLPYNKNYLQKVTEMEEQGHT